MAPTVMPPWMEDEYDDWNVPTQHAVKSYVDTAYLKRQDLEKATIVLLQEIDGQLTVEKNRYGPCGKDLNTSEVINLACEIIVQHMFKGRLKLFREVMKDRLVKSLSQRLRREIKK